MSIPRQVILDLSKDEFTKFIDRQRQEKGLSVYDVEALLYQLLSDIKSEKEVMYSSSIVNMANYIDKLEKKQTDYVVKEESKKEE